MKFVEIEVRLRIIRERLTDSNDEEKAAATDRRWLVELVDEQAKDLAAAHALLNRLGDVAPPTTEPFALTTGCCDNFDDCEANFRVIAEELRRLGAR